MLNNTMQQGKKFLIITSYNSDQKSLLSLLNSIQFQVDKIFIIDNTPDGLGRLDNFKNEKIEIIYLNENTGIGHTQNIGIKEALKEGANYIILSDDDTVYPKDYIEEMIKVFAEKKSEKIAAAAPLYKNILTGKIRPFVLKTPLGFKKFYPLQKGYYEIFQAIASGLVINTKYLEDIGFMREDFFMDWIDLEWCWRAIKKGYKIIGNANVIINHNLGHRTKKFFGRDIPLYNFIRHYYIIRNSIYLALYNKNLDFIHRLIIFIKTFRFVVIYPLLSKPVILHLRYCLLGLWHGVIKKLGKLDVNH